MIRDHPSRRLVRVGTIVFALLVVGAFSGAATAKTLEPPEPPDPTLDTDDGVAGAPAERPGEGTQVGICMIGVESPCNSDKWDDHPEQPLAIEETGEEFDAGLDANDGEFDTRMDAQDPEFDADLTDDGSTAADAHDTNHFASDSDTAEFGTELNHETDR